MMTSTNITSTSTTEDNLIYINFQNETKFSINFYQLRENLQQKQENQMNQAFDQNHQTIIEFNTQQNRELEILIILNDQVHM